MVLTPGNIDDRQPVLDFLSDLFGKIFGVSVSAASRREGIADMSLKNWLLNFC
ncbi:hypothetical protein N0Y54_37585 [Nostoc punctiforme UO1]